MEAMEKPVWLHEPEVPHEEEDANPECVLDFCGKKCCSCDGKLL